MDYSNSFAISALGMNIEHARVDVAALNLANANTVQGTDGSVYRPLRVVADAQAMARGMRPGASLNSSFAALIGTGSIPSAGTQVAHGVHIVSTAVEPRRAYEPGNPLADAKGFVSYAAVDTAAEMVSLMSATRAYEANVSAMNTTRTLALKALEIGGNA